jgi:Ca2+-binding RTX toxin-like protein
MAKDKSKPKGTNGDDILIGTSNNDILIGGKGNDLLDGGAGRDRVLGGRDDDVAVYSMAGNLGTGFVDIGTHDVYDGGKGSDTLVLQLTWGEMRLTSMQKDIAAFEGFLAGGSNGGKTFEFQTFNLDVRNFEALRV